jgi:hypothetical protein
VANGKVRGFGGSERHNAIMSKADGASHGNYVGLFGESASPISSSLELSTFPLDNFLGLKYKDCGKARYTAAI